MVRVKTIEEAAYRYVKKSLMAYMEGGKYARDGKPRSMKWIIEVIRAGVGPIELAQIFNELRTYPKGNSERVRLISVIEECQKLNLL